MTGRLARAALAEDLEVLSRMGPRFMGSDAERATVRHLVDRLSGIPGLEVSTQSFAYLGWRLARLPELRVVAPEAIRIDAIAFIYCAPTPAGGISGRLELLGEHWVIGDYKWDKLAIIRDGEIVGYVSARRDGVAIPQPLAESSRMVPHFGIGTDDAQRLHAWLDAGEEILVEGTIECEQDPGASAENVVATLPAGEERIVVCCHLDSMYTCPGANDNASGMAATIALAEHFARAGCPRTLDFVFFNGEEWDLAGSKAYAARAWERGELDRVRLLVNLDGIAYSAEQLQIWAGPEGLEDALRETVQSFDLSGGPAVKLISPPPMGADHVAFFNLGVPACMFTGYEMVRYHTRADVFEDEIVDNVLRVAEIAGEAVHRLAATPLDFPTRDSLAPRPGWRTIQRSAFA
jgi:hypothetical protein